MTSEPAGALPGGAGLVLGPVGALACSVGNLVSDCFHGMYQTALLGFVGNFIAAFVPYKAWMMLAHERPSAHTWPNLLRFVWVSALGAMACACFLGIGLDRLYLRWYDGLIMDMFTNDFAFALAFGLPLFIVLTSEGAQVMLRPTSAIGKLFTYGLPIPAVRGTVAARRTFLAALTVTLTCLLLLIDNGQTLDGSLPVQVLSVVSGACLLGVCVMPIA